MKKIKDIEEIEVTGETIPIRTKFREPERTFEGFREDVKQRKATICSEEIREAAKEIFKKFRKSSVEEELEREDKNNYCRVQLAQKENIGMLHIDKHLIYIVNINNFRS